MSVTIVDETGERRTKTDFFGDFEFEDLEPNTEVLIRVEQVGYNPKEFNVKTRTDINLGEIVLEKA